jgi:hypothetical protein
MHFRNTKLTFSLFFIVVLLSVNHISKLSSYPVSCNLSRPSAAGRCKHRRCVGSAGLVMKTGQICDSLGLLDGCVHQNLRCEANSSASIERRGQDTHFD